MDNALQEIQDLRNRALKHGFELGGTKTFSHIKVVINNGFTIVRTPLWVIEILESKTLDELLKLNENELFKIIYQPNKL